MRRSVQVALDASPAVGRSVDIVGRPLVIAQLCHGSMGGSSRVACRLSNALSRRGHSVHVFSHQTLPWMLDRRIEQHALRRPGGHAEVPLYWDWAEADLNAFAAVLTVTLTAQRFDILHYHYAQPFAGIVGRIAVALGERMPSTIGTLHGTDLTRCLRDPVARSSMARDLVATGALTTVSQHMRKLAGAMSGIMPLPQVLPNFIDDHWPSVCDTAPRPSERRPSILHVSNFRTVKDVGLLARLFIAVHERTGAELCLVGDGPEMPALRRRLDNSPAAAAVRYRGVCPDPAAYFHEATLLLSTSLEESFGLAVLEAMASGVPVVATAVGGIPELVQNDVTGLLFEPGDFDRTVARIVTLLGSPARLEAMRTASLAKANALRESRVITLYEHLYRETLNSRINRSVF